MSTKLMKGMAHVVAKTWSSIMPKFVRGDNPGGEEFQSIFKTSYPNLHSKLNFANDGFVENYEKAH